jgi:hypothetical protein
MRPLKARRERPGGVVAVVVMSSLFAWKWRAGMGGVAEVREGF